MPTFQFRLERVLEWYESVCRLEENRLATRLAELERTRDEIARLEAELLSTERGAIAARSIPAADLVALGLYRLRAKRQALELEEERARRESAAKDQRARVQAAQRRVRLVGKLRERRLAEHLYAEDRALENLAAEAYLNKWVSAKAAH